MDFYMKDLMLPCEKDLCPTQATHEVFYGLPNGYSVSRGRYCRYHAKQKIEDLRHERETGPPPTPDAA